MATATLEERPTTRAILRYNGRSPYKVRQVVGLIRGKQAEEAQNILLLCERGASEEVSKVLNSAIANAAHNQQIPSEELRVKEAFVDEGPTAKRFRPRARGRGNRILKRSSHITVILERMDEEDIAVKAAKDSTSGAANAREQRRRRAEASKAAAKAKAEALEAEELDAEASDTSSPSEAASSPSGLDEPTVSSISPDASSDTDAPKAEAKKPSAKKTPAEKKPAAAKKPAAKKADADSEDKPKKAPAAKKPAAKKPAAKKTTKKESQGAKDEQPREASGSASASTKKTEEDEK